jgi:hypothetical protein
MRDRVVPIVIALVVAAVVALAAWPNDSCIRTPSNPPGPPSCGSLLLPHYMATTGLAVGIAVVATVFTYFLVARIRTRR